MSVITDSTGVKCQHEGGVVTLISVPPTVTGAFAVPDNVNIILATSFTGCNNITSITIPEAVKHISAGAFNKLPNLEKILVDPHNKSFENDKHGVLFQKNGDWLLGAPRKLKGLYVIPRDTKYIEMYAFKGCKEITTLVIAQSVMSIRKSAFRDCSGLLHLTIPKNVKKIESGVFAGCTQLCGVTVVEENAHFFSDGQGVLLTKDGTRLLWAPNSLMGDYRIPEGVKVVEDGSFYNCKDLVTIGIPQSVETIAEYAFMLCPSVEAYYVHPDNPNYCNDGFYALMTKDETKLIRVPPMLEGRYFISNKCRRVAKNAFSQCEKITELYVPPIRGKVNWKFFDGCTNLTGKYRRDEKGIVYDADGEKILKVWKKIEIADLLPQVTELPGRVFANRKNLKTVIIPNTLESLGSEAFAGCSSLDDIRVGSGNKTIYTDEFGVLYEKIRANIVLVRAPVSLSGSYQVPEEVTHIASCAFEYCTNLEELFIPHRTIVQEGAINNCPGLLLHVKARSWAESYARNHGIKFVID